MLLICSTNTFAYICISLSVPVLCGLA